MRGIEKATIALTILAMVALLAVWPLITKKSAPLPVFGQPGTFGFIDSSAVPFGSDDLKGKIWICDFFFTRCAGPCPVMAKNLSSVYRAFEGDDRVLFLSVSVDPEHDQPLELQKYAKRLNVDAGKWHFVTGDPADVKDLALKGFKMGVTDNLLNHSTRFVLVDAAGNIRGYYDGTHEEEMPALIDDVKRLLNEPHHPEEAS